MFHKSESSQSDETNVLFLILLDATITDVIDTFSRGIKITEKVIRQIAEDEIGVCINTRKK